MHLEDLLAADHVGVRHHHLAVEAARPQQRRVEHVGPVGGGDEDDALIRLEAVHLDEQLVQRLLALVVAAAQAGAAMAADRVDLVDEDDAGCVLLALLEHVADARGADTDEHLDEVRARDGEERHVGLTGDGAGEQRLAGARRADEQHALGDLAAEALEFLRVLQVLDDLLELLLRFVDAGDVVEGDATDLLRQQARARLAEAHGAPAAALHLPHEEDPHGDQQQHGEPVDEDVEQRGHVVVSRQCLEDHILGDQALDQAGIVRRVGRVLSLVAQRVGNGLALDGDVADLALVDLVNELRIGHQVGRAAVGRALEQIEQRHQQ